VIDDVLGLLVLAVVSSLAKGSVNYLELALTGLVAVAFILLVIRYGTAAMGKSFRACKRRSAPVRCSLISRC